MATCYGCEESISDQFIIRVAPDMVWHSCCLRCSSCDINLSDSPSCYMKNGKPFCKNDYDKEFSVKCQGCRNIIDKSSLVMIANSFYYHVTCFNCNSCNDTLVPGDQFSINGNGHIFCHSEPCLQERIPSSDDGWSDANSSISLGTYKETANSIDLDHSPLPSNHEKDIKDEMIATESKPRPVTATKRSCKDKPTRVRTVLNEKQLSTLKRCYAANPRPDSAMKEQLVDLTGLSPRVIRVWFQNKRCKDKKKMMLNGGDGKLGDLLQNHLAVHSSSLNDEISLPGCSPPINSTIHTLQNPTHSGSFVANSTHDLRLMVSNQDYREAASYQSYGMWPKYGNFDCSYHQENNLQGSHFQQLVS